MSDKPLLRLPEGDFLQVVKNTPLVSLDLVVEDHEQRILVGLRNNRPAKGCYFVPGGRIAKNEPIPSAFKRLCFEELGLNLSMEQSQYLGLYDHFYPDSALSDEISTHYVVNAFAVTLDSSGDELVLPTSQHSQYLWLTKDEILSRDDVHLHSKWYFMENASYSCF